MYWVFIGSYTAKDAKGISVSRFDPASGTLSPAIAAAEAANPTFLAVHPGGRLLYAVSEERDATGRHGGGVNAFDVDPGTGRLTCLNRQPSGGAGPCHVSVDHAGRCLLVANYASGSVSALPIGPDGRLAPATAAIQHHGSSAHPHRQSGPHAHSVTLSPDDRFALVADLGLDRVMVYRLDVASGRLEPNTPSGATIAPGSGPRHADFHPSLPVVYLVNELSNTITVFDWHAPTGGLRHAQTVSTLPPQFRGESFAADIHATPNGRFLYASNRGHDSIAVFAVDQSNGLLTPVAHEPALGRWPRNFAIDPKGRWLIVASQHDDSVTVLSIDPVTGRLAPTGQGIGVSMPVCVKLLRRA